jgi:GGDEF domain-containing protein
MEEAFRARRQCCAVALAVDYYPVIADHFGCENADEALALVARRLPAARLYRWSGSALVVVLETVEAANLLLNSIPDRYTIRLRAQGETVEIPFTSRSKVFQGSHFESVAEVCRRIDRWIATPWLD